jgi:hypothetical protein
MISNTDEQFQPRVGSKVDGDSELAKMHTEFLVLFAELRLGQILEPEDDSYIDRAGVKEYLMAHIVGTMLMTMHDVPEVFALTASPSVMIEAKKTILFWLNQSTFKAFYDEFGHCMTSVKEGDMTSFMEAYQSAMFELREYFVTHSVFAGMCLKAKNVQTLEDNLRKHFAKELKRTGCECHNCQVIKQHFKL